MNEEIIVTIAVALALQVLTWVVASKVSVAYMKGQSELQTRIFEEKFAAIDKHLESSDDRHETLLRDFNDHRVKVAHDLANHTNQCAGYLPRPPR